MIFDNGIHIYNLFTFARLIAYNIMCFVPEGGGGDGRVG